MSDCVFCKIAKKEIATDAVYEDEEFLAFNDLNKQAPVHVLVIPKAHYPTVLDADAGVLGRAMKVACEIAKEQSVADSGFRIVTNCRDDGGQSVYHLHIHMMGGRFLNWPPG